MPRLPEIRIILSDRDNTYLGTWLSHQPHVDAVLLPGQCLSAHRPLPTSCSSRHEMQDALLQPATPRPWHSRELEMGTGSSSDL